MAFLAAGWADTWRRLPEVVEQCREYQAGVPVVVEVMPIPARQPPALETQESPEPPPQQLVMKKNRARELFGQLPAGPTARQPPR